jgi:hypothetical protein
MNRSGEDYNINALQKLKDSTSPKQKDIIENPYANNETKRPGTARRSTRNKKVKIENKGSDQEGKLSICNQNRSIYE